MAGRRTTDGPSRPRQAPAMSPEARENQIIAAAYDLAEKQIRDGTASAQLVTHFVRRGSSREKLEEERIAQDLLLTEKKMELMESQKRIEELYDQAIEAMRSYAGHEPEETYDD